MTENIPCWCHLLLPCLEVDGALDPVVPHVFTEQATDVNDLQCTGGHESRVLCHRVEHDTPSGALVCWIQLAMNITIITKII